MVLPNINRYVAQAPIIKQIMALEPVFWINGHYWPFITVKDTVDYTYLDIKDAEERLERFHPFIKDNFEDTVAADGLIESPLSRIKHFQKDEAERYSVDIPGRLYLKLDDLLPISATIKARGAIHGVLVHAEEWH